MGDSVQVIQAFARCAAAAIDSADGRVIRWPRALAIKAATLDGASPAVAQACADAMLAVGAAVRAVLAGEAHAR
jgi:hypothetical protein